MIIAAVVLLNATVGVIQEGKAQKALESLKKLTTRKALVRRDGKLLEMDAAELVPGDRVLLNAGQQVPADPSIAKASVLPQTEAFSPPARSAHTPEAALSLPSHSIPRHPTIPAAFLSQKQSTVQNPPAFP